MIKKNLLKNISDNKKIIFVLMLINFLAAIYSITYYLPQLDQTNFWLWLFVIDCPLYSFLFGILLFFKLKQKHFPLIGLIVITGCIKYALWTLFVLFLMNNIFNAYLITVSHILLLFQTIIFYKFFEFKIKHVLFVISWFLLNDFFDYVLLLHPFFDTNLFLEVKIFSILSSFFIVLFVSIVFFKK